MKNLFYQVCIEKLVAEVAQINIGRGIKYKINRPKDKVKSQQALKIRLLEIKGRKCERCSYNKYEILQVHHKNKDRNDNNIDNLELICPNCHFEEHYLEKSWLKDIIKKGGVG